MGKYGVIEQLTAESDTCQSLLAFLNKESLDTSDIYSHLLFFTLTKNDGDKFYYIHQQIEEKQVFLAVIGLKLEKRRNISNQIQKSWRISGWATDPIHLVDILRTTHDDGTIDWKADYIRLFFEDHQPSLPVVTCLNQMNCATDNLISLYMFCLPKEEALNIQISCPDDVYVTSLKPCHAKFPYSSWSGRDSSSIEDMAQIITQLPSAGVFLKCNDELVSWAVCHSTSGGLNHLWTVEEHRRKGYAKLVVQHLSKQLAQSGYVPFALIYTSNDVSQQFFSSLGFKLTRKSHVCDVLPKAQIDESVSCKACR